jgi:hypothetical protein
VPTFGHVRSREVEPPKSAFGELGKQLPFFGIQKLVAPLVRVSKGLVSNRSITPTRGKELQSLIEAFEDLARRQQANSRRH